MRRIRRRLAISQPFYRQTNHNHYIKNDTIAKTSVQSSSSTANHTHLSASGFCQILYRFLFFSFKDGCNYVLGMSFLHIIYTYYLIYIYAAEKGVKSRPLPAHCDFIAAKIYIIYTPNMRSCVSISVHGKEQDFILSLTSIQSAVGFPSPNR